MRITITRGEMVKSVTHKRGQFMLEDKNFACQT